MKITEQGKVIRLIFYALLIVIVVSLLLLPFWLNFLTLPEKIFLITFIVLIILYSKVFASFYIISSLLNLIEKEEDVNAFISDKLSQNSLINYIEKNSLFVLAESLILKAKESATHLFDVTLIFALLLLILNIGNNLDPNIFYSAMFAVLIVWIFEYSIEIYTDLKFKRIFEKEIENKLNPTSETLSQEQTETSNEEASTKS